MQNISRSKNFGKFVLIVRFYENFLMWNYKLIRFLLTFIKSSLFYFKFLCQFIFLYPKSLRMNLCHIVVNKVFHEDSSPRDLLIYWLWYKSTWVSAKVKSSGLWYSQIWNYFTWEIAYHSNVKPSRNGQEKANLELLCWIHSGHFCILLSNKYETFFPTRPRRLEEGVTLYSITKTASPKKKI